MAQSVARFTAFVAGVREELQQVAWPGREELIGSALVVFVGVAILAAYIFIWDQVLSVAARIVLR